MNRSLLIFATCAALMAPLTALAVPLQVAHQGEVQDADGPVTDTLEFVFALFDAASDGNEVWSETRDVDVVDGNYTVLLGSVTAIDSVLFTEPALWLQITIEGGDPLLPRQPIASAPYAIVANTAVNVSGGTVDASSIAVNGLSVVNSTGQWVGPAGSIDWSAITGAPSDADTLGGLSCADGDRAVWSDSNQLWECGSSTVTLDRLDPAGATNGDVLSYSGTGGAAWTASGGSSCATTVLSDDLAEVDCGTGPLRLKLYPEYIDATANWRLRSDGTLLRLPGDNGAITPAPSGAHTEIGGGSFEWALSTAGAVVMLDTNQSLPPPSGAYTAVEAITAGLGCALTTTGEITCWNSYSYSAITPPTLGGTGYIDFAVAQPSNSSLITLCGLTSAGQVQCAGYADYVANAPAGTGWSHIHSSGSSFDVVKDTGTWASWAYTVPAYYGACAGPGPYLEFEGGIVLDTAGAAWGCGSTGGLSRLTGYSAPIRRWRHTPGVVLTDGRLYSGANLIN